MSEPGQSGGLVATIQHAAPVSLDLSLECARGEVLALVGPSGAGKSMFLRAIAGLWRPTSGKVVCGDETWMDRERGQFTPPHRRSLGFVFQSYALFPHMSAAANIEASLGDRPKAERRKRVGELLDMMHLHGLGERRPSQLSGGQQQRVAVARALARDPKALLLDEPFSAVDRSTRASLYGELAELRRSLATPIILVTHDVDEAARLADRMCLIDRGKVVQAGPPGALLARPGSMAAARLMNLPNLFEGRVAGQDATGVRIEWAGQLIAARPDGPCPPSGSAVGWTIASTRITPLLGQPPQGEANAVRATVRETFSLAESIGVRAAVEDGPGEGFLLSLPAGGPAPDVSPGAEVWLTFAPQDVRLIGGV